MKSWPMVPIGDLTEIIGGGTPARSNPSYFGGNIPWVTPKDMKRWHIHTTTINITDAGLAASTTRIAPADSVLVVVRSGVLKHTLPVALSQLPVAINQDMKALICSERLHPSYLARFIKARSPVILQQVRSTTADNFPIDTLRKLPIPLPPLQEQRRIAQIFDKADDLRTKRRAALAAIDELAQSVFLDTFSSEILRQGSALGDHLTFVTSGGRGWARYYATEGARFIRSLDVRMNDIDDREAVYVAAPDNAEARRTRVHAGDILLTITGSLIGRVAPVPSRLEGSYVSQHVAILRLSSESLRPEFLSYYMSLPSGGQKQIKNLQYGQTKPGLNFKQIRSIGVPVPSISAQDKFLGQLATTRRLRKAQLGHIDDLDTLFASLEHDTFRG